MTFLFRSGSLREKLRAILQATYTHSSNLACFVFTYKGLCALQSHLQGETCQVHSFLAAFIGGFLVFGNNNNINSQMMVICPKSWFLILKDTTLEGERDTKGPL
uniref:Peroxisomal membrane protein 4 n=1 Tax=Molossus molossus TaxID=27622 RepID=A0A7J8HIP9_MOLMO|nr:peroxisomal membrane protein 4 [Molossus molossus]